MSDTDDLPILKGILKGDCTYRYHNAPVRFGRVPKREKAKILAAMQQSSNAKSQEKALATELEDEHKLSATVIRAHLDTCDFTRDKVEPMIVRAREQPGLSVCPTTLACPLNPNPQPLTGQQQLLQDFSERFSPAIRGVVEFAKRIPGFSVLAQDDQVTLLKAGVFEVLLVRLACMFDSQTNSMLCLNGQVVRREAVHNSCNARFLLDSMFDFADRLNALRLTDAQIGLFCAVVVISSDRPGLRNTELIEKMQSKLKGALQTALAQTHPDNPTVYQELIKKIPDLRTLNTLHSEKLLAFKMTEQQQQQQQQQQHLQQLSPNSQLYRQAMGGSNSSASSIWEESSKGSWDDSKSPVWSEVKEEAYQTMYEGVKSPLGSVSSSESVCSGEVATLTDVRTAAGVAAMGVLAAALAPNSNKRRRDNSHSEGGSTSGDECSSAGDSPKCPLKLRKLDSPSDSGIESGPEKADKLSSSAPTSVCSSPRSSVEDKVKEEDEEKGSESIEDMPVLKRALQAPPLYDTNLLMDEAYKPHKKFRALRKGTPEPESASSGYCPVTQHQSSPAMLSHLAYQHQQHYPHQPSAMSPSSTSSVGSSSPSTSSASPPVGPPMSVLSAALLAPLPSSSGAPLSSTHSTLAKSLMEGPKMTAEQLKRTDILHNIIMRGGEDYPHSSSSSSSSSTSSMISQPSSVVAYSGQASYPSSRGGVVVCNNDYYIPQQSPPQQQQRPSTSSPPCWPYGGQQPSRSPLPHHMQQQQQPKSSSPSSTAQLYPRVYYDHRTPSPVQPQQQQPPQQQPSPKPSSSPVPPTSTLSPLARALASSSKVVELQVDIADSQPLNLSKKTPPPPSHKIPLEA